MELKEYRGYLIRPGTMDDYVINELGSYRHMPITTNDVVLDIGANIGSFAKHALRLQARKVVAVEPDPENFALLLKNAGFAYCINAAVTKDPVDKIQLYQNRGKNKGLHSTVKTLGRDIVWVDAISFRDLMDFRPTKIKIDTEGAEYDYLDPELIPDCCTGVIIEYNLTRKREKPSAEILHNIFLELKWTVVKTPKFTNRAWATMACYER